MILFENGSTTALQSSNTFVNIPGGFHELIVENKDGCGLVKVLQYYKQHSLRQMETVMITGT
jgi:hypothetical protein